MATIKYQLQSKSENAPIYLRLSLGRNKLYKRKTSLSINPKEWSSSTSQPKQTTAKNKNLASKLSKLKDFILDEVNNANTKGVEINGDWLQSKIDLHFNKFEVVELDYITEYGSFHKELKVQDKRQNQKNRSYTCNSKEIPNHSK